MRTDDDMDRELADMRERYRLALAAHETAATETRRAAERAVSSRPPPPEDRPALLDVLAALPIG